MFLNQDFKCFVPPRKNFFVETNNWQDKAQCHSGERQDRQRQIGSATLRRGKAVPPKAGDDFLN